MYRLLNVNDGHEYAALVHDAYQADGELGIDFAAVTLGTAAEHPWLVKMYESWGFETVETKTLPGNSHQTVYMKKSYL